jgi:hypothetical protein
MTAFLLASLLAGALAPAGEGARADLRVTATDAAGGADAGLASALAQALIDAGLPAAPDRGAPGDCRNECVRVSVRKTEDRGFVIELSGRGDLALAPVRPDPTASSFDQVHALAIEVELLAERMRAPRRRHARPAAVAVSRPPAATPRAVDVAIEEGAPATDAEPELVPPQPMDEPVPAPAPGPAVDQAVPAVRQPAPKPTAAPADERLALNVAAMVVAGTSGDLVMHGSTLGLRLRLTHRLDARASIALLRPENVEQQGTSYHLELLPLAASVAYEIPGVPSLRAGGGIEALLVTGDRDDRDGPSYWAFGPTARVEYRYGIRSFALFSAVQAALHPASWSAGRDDGPRVAIPLWTVGASLGLEFKVF